jgi:hypothetical protein
MNPNDFRCLLDIKSAPSAVPFTQTLRTTLVFMERELRDGLVIVRAFLAVQRFGPPALGTA